MNFIPCVSFCGSGGESCGSIAHFTSNRQTTAKSSPIQNTIFQAINKTNLLQPERDVFEKSSSKFGKNQPQ